jgi:thioredoxin-dependent peroxiredoxin
LLTQTKLGPNTANLIEALPSIGSVAPAFIQTANDMSDKTFTDFAGKKIIFNIFPSIDTGVCAASICKFNQRLASFESTAVLCISKYLPFAQKQFCGTESSEKAITLSDFRGRGFGEAYGVELTELEGLKIQR